MDTRLGTLLAAGITAIGMWAEGTSPLTLNGPFAPRPVATGSMTAWAKVQTPGVALLMVKVTVMTWVSPAGKVKLAGVTVPLAPGRVTTLALYS